MKAMYKNTSGQEKNNYTHMYAYIIISLSWQENICNRYVGENNDKALKK
jgi:hypothetical protein